MDTVISKTSHLLYHINIPSSKDLSESGALICCLAFATPAVDLPKWVLRQRKLLAVSVMTKVMAVGYT